MKIALFTDGITPYVVGGIQRHSFYLCKYLAKKGVQVDLYHTGNSEDFDPDKLEFFSEEERGNIRSYFIPFPKHKRLPGHYIRESYSYSCLVYESFMKNSREVDFVYSKNYTSWKYLKEKNKGVELPPIGVNLHGYELYQYYNGLKDNFFVMQHKKPTVYNTKNADVVFSYGKGITDLILRNIKVDQNKVVEIPTGISNDWVRGEIEEEMTNEISFIFIGRYTKRKGVHFIHQFIEENPNLNYKVNFIGPIPSDVQIKSEKVIYHGQLTDSKQMKSIVDTNQVLLCPSYSEGMPNVIMEGMARGCAVLTTRVGAVGDMVDESNGWLINAGDYMGFQEKMLHILSTSPNLITEKRKKSIDRVKNSFLWENVSDQVINEIKRIIG